MPARFHSKFIAALLAPALLMSGAAQGLLLMRCGASVRMSCCCPENQAAPARGLTVGTPHCCDKIVVPSAPPQNVERAVPGISVPVLVAVLGPSLNREPVIERFLQARRIDRPPETSPVLANCTLLI